MDKNRRAGRTSGYVADRGATDEIAEQSPWPAQALYSCWASTTSVPAVNRRHRAGHREPSRRDGRADLLGQRAGPGLRRFPRLGQRLASERKRIHALFKARVFA